MGDTSGKDHGVELGSERDSMTKSVLTLRPRAVARARSPVDR
jgi:hypothetical protein